jgi:hypothetical protein
MTRLNLKRVTAICIDGRPYSEEVYSKYRSIFNYMNSCIEFSEIIFVGTTDPLCDFIKFHKTNPLSINDYSRICLLELTNYVNSDFCLIFQLDGFALNPELWNDSFYEYDYIGAPWPLSVGWVKEGRQVGNGGFSLRSKKFLNLTSTFTEYEVGNEDGYIFYAYDIIIRAGLKIAPLEIAKRFAIEIPLDESHNISTCFGFHAHDIPNDYLISKLNIFENS